MRSCTGQSREEKRRREIFNHIHLLVLLLENLLKNMAFKRTCANPLMSAMSTTPSGTPAFHNTYISSAILDEIIGMTIKAIASSTKGLEYFKLSSLAQIRRYAYTQK